MRGTGYSDIALDRRALRGAAPAEYLLGLLQRPGVIEAGGPSLVDCTVVV